MKIITAIMAGGLGKRMNTGTPKVLNLVNNKPMICHVIDQALSVGSQYILIIVGKFKDQIKSEIEKHFPYEQYSNIKYIDQTEPLGTGHAVACCIDFFTMENIDLSTQVLILSGDVPLIKTDTISNILSNPNSLLITELENPYGCGRILFNGNAIDKIVEEKDCNDEQRKIKHVNCGIYNLTASTIKNYIPLIKNDNKNNEYYLTDIIEIAKNHGTFIKYYGLPKEKQQEIININTFDDLMEANKLKN
jgi:bifunctional N-acetylglucosamine-1-phosphate-uridyltransferase/glucosamine-1-phosphate-acetyltransferase GlmU-like protein